MHIIVSGKSPSQSRRVGKLFHHYRFEGAAASVEADAGLSDMQMSRRPAGGGPQRTVRGIRR